MPRMTTRGTMLATCASIVFHTMKPIYISRKSRYNSGATQLSQIASDLPKAFLRVPIRTLGSNGGKDWIAAVKLQD
jgi:hypothetical protein